MRILNSPPPEGRTARSICRGQQLRLMMLNRAAHDACRLRGLIVDAPCPSGGTYELVPGYWFITCTLHAGIREASAARRRCRELLGRLGPVVAEDLATALARLAPDHADSACAIAAGRDGRVWCWEHGFEEPANSRSACYDNQRRLHVALGDRTESFGGERSLTLMDELVAKGRLVERVYCFDNGRYVRGADGVLVCSVHGEIADQPFVDDHGNVIDVLAQPPPV